MADPGLPPPHRYVTTENIRIGDVILEEEAWIWSFTNLGSARLVCNYCFKSSNKLLSCSACKSAFYCNATCQRNDWRLRHKHEECQNLSTIRKVAAKTPGAVMQNFEEVHFNVLTPRLLLSAASARLFHAKERDEKGDPVSPLWKTFMETPYKADLIDLRRDPQSLVSAVCRLVKHKDTPKLIIQNRVLPSLVVLWNHEPWKKVLEKKAYTTELVPMPQPLALGACLEMSKHPNSCDRPNAITINEGRTVRMVAMEDIPNLDAIRLTRMPAWLYEHRYTRRTAHLYKFYGYGCYCSRCSAGDTAAETTLFALRCPQWAKHYPQTNKKQACAGIVKGLRRTDISDFGINTLTGKMDPDVDEPHPLSFRAQHAPAHERAVCMQCESRYDVETMQTKILPLLKFMEMMRVNIQHCIFISVDHTMRDEWTTKVIEAEQFVWPTNYVFLAAKRTLMRRVMHAVESKFPSLHPNAGTWLKNYVREALARVEADGCQQIDLFGLQEIVGIYGQYVEVARKAGNRRGGMVDAEACELMVQTSKSATKKLKLLLQMRE